MEEKNYKTKLYGQEVDVLRLPFFIRGSLAKYDLHLVDEFPDVFEEYYPSGLDSDDPRFKDEVRAIRTGALTLLQEIKDNAKAEIKEGIKSELKEEWKKVSTLERVFQAFHGKLNFPKPKPKTLDY